jgi:hypothetical protein
MQVSGRKKAKKQQEATGMTTYVIGGTLSRASMRREEPYSSFSCKNIKRAIWYDIPRHTP